MKTANHDAIDFALKDTPEPDCPPEPPTPLNLPQPIILPSLPHSNSSSPLLSNLQLPNENQPPFNRMYDPPPPPLDLYSPPTIKNISDISRYTPQAHSTKNIKLTHKHTTYEHPIITII